VQLAAARHHEAALAGKLLDLHADVDLLLLKQARFQVPAGDELAVLAREGLSLTMNSMDIVGSSMTKAAGPRGARR